MKYIPIAVVLCAILLPCISEAKDLRDTVIDKAAIKKVLAAQVAAWNKGDIDAFMEGYWKSDSLVFVGSRINYGWKPTRDQYKKTYSTKAGMGTLKFQLAYFKEITPGTWVVSGFWALDLKENPHGAFTLLFQKKEGKWVIIQDHTSSDK